MATTNREIIATARMIHGINEPVDTLPGWNRRGKSIKAGSKALFTTAIWKPCQIKTENPEGGVTYTKKLMLVNACFFGLSQTV